jgi:endogenous inhibitor of DNA gyrase (YacG/DUF329 family)
LRYGSGVAAHPCPICKKPVEKEAAAWPFCCERCRLVDLGNWLGGRYAIPGTSDQAPDAPVAPDEPDEEGPEN